jgi:hypothetical protein
MPPHVGGEGMTGNRTLRFRHIVHNGRWRTRHSQLHSHRSRRDDSAPIGAGVKAKPAARVDLRSSLDPDPFPAFVCTESGIGVKPIITLGLTARSFRDDLPGDLVINRDTYLAFQRQIVNKRPTVVDTGLSTTGYVSFPVGCSPTGRRTTHRRPDGYCWSSTRTAQVSAGCGSVTSPCGTAVNKPLPTVNHASSTSMMSRSR